MAQEHAATILLKRAHTPDTAEEIFRERVKLRPLLLRPSSPDPALNARSKRQHDRLKKQQAQRRCNKPKPLSAKRKRILGIYDIPKEQQKWSIYEPLHEMWCRYIRDVLGMGQGDSETRKTWIDGTSAGPVLASADYHGALLEVVRSRCAGRVGLRGIIVKDTKYTFEIVTRRDELKTVPKEYTVFRFEVPFAVSSKQTEQQSEPPKPFCFEIHGSSFEVRAPDRANKKFKMHHNPDL
ncbi:RNase P/MRP, p29 subunit [Polychaeton citri CBS 116435]|uniref:Ribonuclease P protein subunit n=1 Tax=Polychaeton citri CBS 116435 TaxID=1314669 RepID=A0A9P4QEA2_9PEZI|nr:RNase P/MRP, p29 subunit [Polychaeton citri CBS 116435]